MVEEILRYTNCWEDAEILLKALQPKPQSNILSVASAGDNSFALLTTQPKQVVCVDINAIQLHLTALKQACFRVLDYEKMLCFLGFLPVKNTQLRWSILQELKPVITDLDTWNFWQNNKKMIENGIIYEGKFEKYFRFFSQKLLIWIHSRKTIQALFSPKNQEEQILFYDKKWNNWRWRLIFRIFFSRYVMGKYGRDKSFFNEVKIPVADYIYQKTSTHFRNIIAQNNHLLHFILVGNFGEMLPFYAKPENFEIIKKNIDKMVLFKGKVEDALLFFDKFDCFNLSNIFEYMPDNVFLETAKKLSEMAENNASFAYWNLMVSRKMSQILPKNFQIDDTNCNLFRDTDKGFFYSQMILEHKV